MHIKWNSTTFAILYLIFPVILFFVNWLHWYIGIPAGILLGIAGYSFLSSKEILNEDLTMLSKTKESVIASMYVLLYLLLTGHGLFFGSSGVDIPWRNAIYQDLIQQSWPVIYEYSQSALIYYLTYWLVPAGISTFLGLGRWSSNLVLAIWTYVGLRVFVSILWDYLKLNHNQIIPITLMFLFWSGLNILGMLIMSMLDIYPLQIDTEWGWTSWWYTRLAVDGYSTSYMIRTVFDNLGNVYNQFVPTLLIVMLFLKYKKVKWMAFFGLLTVPYSPLGFIGLFLLMFFETIRQGIYAKTNKVFSLFIKNVFSTSNIIAVCVIMPIFLFYFMSNTVANSVGASSDSIFFAPLSEYGFIRIFILGMYYIFQFGIFMRLCYRYNQEKFLFWSILLSLLIIPIFRVGNSNDFCWNASMPGFYIIMIFMMQEVLRLFRENKAGKQFFLIAVVITLAALTPCFQIVSGLRKCAANGEILVNVDHAHVGGTLSNKSREEIIKGYGNFANAYYMDSVFFKYLVKK